MAELTREERKLALDVARRSIVAYLKTGKYLTAGELGIPEGGIFHENRAVFVTLKKRRNLRGCIGHILPFEPLWKSIRDNAVSSAIHDNRFRQVDFTEVPDLSIDISVLSPPYEVSGPGEFKAGVHGVLMELNGHRAVFLPQVAPEQGWNETTTLMNLSMKAGLPQNAWQDPRAKFSLFTAEVFGEDEGD